MDRYRQVMILSLMALCVGAATMAPAPETLAAPEIVVFYGDPLTKPIIIAGWEVNHRWLLKTDVLYGDQRPRSSELSQRASIRVALFWGHEWRAYTHPDSLRLLRPERANQHGRFYPAIGSRNAFIDLGTFRSITDSGVVLLRAHGIPVRVQSQR